MNNTKLQNVEGIKIQLKDKLIIILYSIITVTSLMFTVIFLLSYFFARTTFFIGISIVYLIISLASWFYINKYVERDGRQGPNKTHSIDPSL